MFIRAIVQNLLGGLRRRRQLVDQNPFVLLNTFGADLLEEEVDDEPPQPRRLTLGTPPFLRPQAVHAIYCCPDSPSSGFVKIAT